jgi:hypothetical protein
MYSFPPVCSAIAFIDACSFIVCAMNFALSLPGLGMFTIVELDDPRLLDVLETRLVDGV